MSKKPKTWPASTVEHCAIAELHPYPRNPNKHSSEQIELIKQSMLARGWTMPILVDEDNMILAGHGRVLAAQILVEEGHKQFAQAPIVIARGWSKADKQAYIIADNQLTRASEWDPDLLKMELGELVKLDFDMKLTGFNDVELAKFMAGNVGESDPEIVPEPPTTPIVRLGDVWILGKHRLICEDATNSETWKRLFGKNRAAMSFTDPPYGVSYEARSGKFDVIMGDQKRRDDLYKMLINTFRHMVKYLTDTGAVYIWHASSTREDFAQAMKAAGLVERQYLIWAKPAIVLGHSDYLWQHEPCFYASKDSQKPAFYGDRGESTVWHIQMASAKEIAATIGNGLLLLDGLGNTLYVQSRAPKNKKMRQIRITEKTSIILSGSDRRDTTVWQVSRDPDPEHPTQKPVELARRAIENSSQPGEIIMDGFLGSGTTLMGAEMTARRCFGSEIDPIYAEVIIRRWEKFTGQAAAFEDTNQTFEEVGHERLRPARRHPKKRRARLRINTRTDSKRRTELVAG